jgi:hypothetical protein
MAAAVLLMSDAPCDDAQLDPAYLRSRAQFYRDLADEETDREKGALYREVANAFNRDADARESGTSN